MENKNKIINLLKKNPKGLTIKDLTEKAKLSWNTITKILAKIEGEGNLNIREVGRAKLHYWKNKEEVDKK